MDDEKKNLEKSEETETKPKAKKTEEVKEESKKKEAKLETKEEKPKTTEKKETEKPKTEKAENKSTFKVVKPSESETKVEEKKEPKKETKKEKKPSKKEVKKEGKKKHVGWTIFWLILLILILVVVYHSLRINIIFAKISNNAANYSDLDNFEYDKKVITDSVKEETKKYYLSGLYKIEYSLGADKSITLIAMQNKVAQFVNNNGTKSVTFVAKNDENSVSSSELENCTVKLSKWYDMICANIEEDDENNYVITSPTLSYAMTLNDKDADLTNAKSKYYVNKDTGLISKIEEVKSDGTVVATITYTYDFNSVTQSDLSMQDISTYTIAD